MSRAFRVIIIGATGQVGGAVVQELLATAECRDIKWWGKAINHTALTVGHNTR